MVLSAVHGAQFNINDYEGYGYGYTTAIGYDFRDEIPEMVEYYERKRENSLSTFEKIEADRDFWRDEYARILKEKNELLKKIEILEAKLVKK